MANDRARRRAIAAIRLVGVPRRSSRRDRAVALDAPGCLGFRMTGGGFAGSAVALVAADRAVDFEHAVVDRHGYDGHTTQVRVCAPSPGHRGGLVTDVDLNCIPDV
ncbi:MAG: hypothetical protein WKF60_00695 [Ilumatobacter sp.]